MDLYVAHAPEPAAQKFSQLRAIIRSAAPKASESISYGMPYYHYKGRLAYFGLCRKHIGLYVPPPVIAGHSSELKDFVTTKSAVHLPLDRKLPASLIRKLIKARMIINEKQGAGKQ